MAVYAKILALYPGPGTFLLGTVALVVCALGQPLVAQEGDGAACFRGRRLPTCRSFWVTDAAAGLGYVAGRSEVYLAADLGWMRNVNDRTAVGATIGIGHSGDGFVALRPRLRRWITPAIGLDISPGVRWTPGRIETVELLGGLSVGEWAGVVIGPTFDFGGSEFGFVAAGRGSSYAGLAAYLAGAVAATIYVITFDSS